MHRVFVPGGTWKPGDRLRVDGPEAHHALRVKRVEVGERVEILDGQGVIAAGVVVTARRVGGEDGHLEIVLDEVRNAARPRPSLRVCACVPKGDRVEWMIDQLTQVGAASWTPLRCERSEDPTRLRLGRLERAAREAAKQCGRAWAFEIQAPADFSAVIAHGVLFADAAAAPMAPPATSQVTLMVGPEGGWTDAERAHALAAGVAAVRLGPHIMRIETAAVVGAGLVMLSGTHAGAGR